MATTTVATVLDRLFNKGLVERELKRSRSLHYEYRPSITRRELENSVVMDVLEGLFETFGDAVIKNLIDQANLNNSKEIKEFKQYIERARKEMT